MDEELVDEATQLEVAEDSQRQNKDSPHTECRKILQSQEARIPVKHDYSQLPPREYDGVLHGKSVVEGIDHADTSQHPGVSLFMDDGDAMVEELTVKSYNGSSLDIGTSNNRGHMYTWQNHRQNFYQVASNSGIGNSLSDIGTRNSVQATSSAREDIGSSSFPEILARKSLSDGQSNVMEHLAAAENKEGAGDVRQGIRTKIISQSGFAEFFIKNTLKGKGIVYKGPSYDAFCAQSREQNRMKTNIGTEQNQMRTSIGTEQNQMRTSIGTEQNQMRTSIGTEKNQMRSSIDTDQNQTRTSISTDQNQIKISVGTDQNQTKTSIGTDQNQMRNNTGTDQKQVKTGIVTHLNSNQSAGYGSKTTKFSSYCGAMPRSGKSECNGVTLREWLKHGHHKTSKVESLNIFRKIVDLVDNSHSQGVALHNLCPSYIKLSPSNQVMYLGLPVQKRMVDGVVNSEVVHVDSSVIRKRHSEQVAFPSHEMGSKKQRLNENLRVTGGDLALETASDRKLHSGSQDIYNEYEEDTQFSKYNIGRMSTIPHVSNAGQIPLTSCEKFENKWYTSPEGGYTTSSNIYCLGVLLFELLGHFESERTHIAAMSDLRHRILPPIFLSENPKEAGFCLWLLHPEPSSRPTTREILQSELINGLQEFFSEELSSSIDQEDAESELLLHFLVLLKEQKQNNAFKLAEEIKCLESDIGEVERRHDSRNSLVSSGLQNDYSCQKEITPPKKESLSLEMLPSMSPNSNSNEVRLMRNICHLESAYFSMRSKLQLSETDTSTHPDKDVLRNRENWSVTQKGEEQPKRKDTLGAFFDGLCKYARYCKFEVRGVLRNADFNNPANVICSLSFDRDADYFASAGISKKIKIFEFSALCNDSVDIHYPVVEMSNRSKLSCVCWNNYIKNYLASTDYDGIVKLWDASTGQEFSQFTEHEKRAWSVDFSVVCPTKFASGSDDCTVKLWSISERNCLGTIRNVANVCCVQFSAHSSHLLAFGSADYSTYCYDLRNLRSPWCVLAGHRKAVSYVKFLDSETLVSASTDNTLKIWDLNKTSPVGASTNACSLTLSGHTNEKNFVGLSVADGYIACGSETNEVYSYYRSLPMPITSHKFGSIDPISGKDTEDDNGQFVSSVCWRGKSDMLIAANSSGCVKVLQMI
ncbi:E3 ubiquitin-protein ligase RFWD2 [Vigna unguiculata]|uniref:E3 ubiquitin-protein ligase RFWD2 n=1 Tax=Vigna unguiculata TaxID=3917 RepID=A0A4D6LT97_VIGUN|nr:E3 ubiquitin-protein ligase RFWD2 [Vigna unguiculata]